jgi:LmbE family N-acetylglucosaminyl deacetylase
MTGKLLLVGAHPDDIEFGAGGTVARFVEEGMEVKAIIFSNCAQTLTSSSDANTLLSECKSAMKKLNVSEKDLNFFDIPVRNFPEHRQAVLQILIEEARAWQPDLVLYPNSEDIHQDHSTVGKEIERALKHSTLWSYELPWNNQKSDAQGFVELSPKFVDQKIEAISQYKSQESRFYAAPERIKAHLIARGSQIEVEFAEMFAIPRAIRYL